MDRSKADQRISRRYSRARGLYALAELCGNDRARRLAVRAERRAVVEEGRHLAALVMAEREVQP